MTMPSNVSHEQRQAWGRKGGLAYAARSTAAQRRLSSAIACKARSKKYTSEQLRHVGPLPKRFAQMMPEEVSEYQRKAGQARMRALTPEQRSEAARKAVTCYHDKLAYAKNPEMAERICAFLETYISQNHFSPTFDEIQKAAHGESKLVQALLRALERDGRLERSAHRRGITLKMISPHPAPVISFGTEPEAVTTEVFVPRPKKCSECNAPAVSGMSKCELHRARGNVASLRSYFRKKAIKP